MKSIFPLPLIFFCHFSHACETSDNTYAYVANNHNSTLFHSPQGITLNAAQTRAYITNEGSHAVTRCQIEPTTSALTDCESMEATPFSGLGKVALNQSETCAYLPDAVHQRIWSCSIHPATGAFFDCVPSQVIFHHPAGVVLISSI